MGRNMMRWPEVDAMAEQLRVYDVVQGAWEQEPHGYVANATHVLTHLAKGLTIKNFTDPETVKNELAPDSLQYALRLMRWTDQPPVVSMDHETEYVPTYVQDTENLQRRPDFASMPLHQIAYIGATARLAAALHEEDHESTRIAARRQRDVGARVAACLLTYSASLQASEFDFDLVPAFEQRLSVLRDHFGIPEPQVD